MEKKEVVESIGRTLQDLSFPIWQNPVNTTATTMEIGMVEPEDIAEETPLQKRQSADVAVFVGPASVSDKSNITYPSKDKKYFWRQAISPGLAYASEKQPYIYEVIEEYLGFPGEAVGSVSPWPGLWRQSNPQPTDLRGVFPTNYTRKVLFTKLLTFKTSELPRWKPKNIIGLRTFEEEDA